MTLVHADRVNMSITFGSAGLREPERLISSQLLIGAHVPPDYLYPKVRFRVPGLLAWLAAPIIQQSWKGLKEADGPEVVFNVRRPALDTIRLPQIEATLEWDMDLGSKVDQFSSIDFVISGWMTIKPDTPKTLEWYLEQQHTIWIIQAFLAGTPDCIEGSIDESRRKVYALLSFQNPKYCSYNHPGKFFMHLATIGTDFAEVLNAWFNVYPKVKAPSSPWWKGLFSSRVSLIPQ